MSVSAVFWSLAARLSDVMNDAGMGGKSINYVKSQTLCSSSVKSELAWLRIEELKFEEEKRRRKEISK